MKKKNRVAIYYNNRLRNDGPPLYYYFNMRDELKLDVTHLIPQGDTRNFGKFDYHFWVDFGEDSFDPEACSWMPPKDGGKTIYVVSDAHLDNGYRLQKAAGFDYVFVNQKYYLDEFKKVNPNTFYLPHAAEPKAYPASRHFVIPKYDLCFIGHIQENHKDNGINVSRLEVLDHMFKEFPNFYFGTRVPQWPSKHMFEHAALIFGQSRIVFNISVGNDVNMRFFETLSAGGFLLTNRILELKSLEERGLIDGEHYVSYSSLEEAVGKAKYYIEHDEERRAIAKAGHKAFKEGHTYKHRVQEILTKVG
jgi:spore maturation protein CgeB